METLLLPFSPRFIILTICGVVTVLLLGIALADHKIFDLVLICVNISPIPPNLNYTLSLMCV